MHLYAYIIMLCTYQMPENEVSANSFDCGSRNLARAAAECAKSTPAMLISQQRVCVSTPLCPQLRPDIFAMHPTSSPCIVGCREVARAVAGGAEINTCCTGQPVMDLIRDTNALAGGADLEPPTTTANLTALHFACQVCFTPLTRVTQHSADKTNMDEMLLQWSVMTWTLPASHNLSHPHRPSLHLPGLVMFHIIPLGDQELSCYATHGQCFLAWT